ncbi:class IV adenylate cyclase [Plantactinospora veratri]|uniref:Class IV adenylate cyclase n=1 Tax=Plantactinospora veratri TaxID=1436122 RepID=A0ABU7SBW6_9ACTN
MELEFRFRLSGDEFARCVEKFDWSPPMRVCDLTLGPSGATSMQTHGWVIRLRQTPGRTRMEYKAPTNPDWSAWKEIGTDVADFGVTAEILRLAGLQVGLLLDRVRRVATDGPVTLSLDDVKGLGQFVEIEVEADGPDDRDAHRELERVRADLGLLGRDTARPYGEILLNRLESEPDFRLEHEQMIKTVQ